MAESIREKERKLKIQKVEGQDNPKPENKPKSEEEHQINKKMIEKNIGKKEAKKEVAKEAVKKKTGYDVEALASVAKEVLETGDAYAHGPVGEAMDSMARIKGNAVNDMLTKMVGDAEVTRNMLKAGLGSKFLSTGEQGIRHGAQTVLSEKKDVGDAVGMQKMLCEAVNWGDGMSMSEIRDLRISPKKLKRNIKEVAAEAPRIPVHTVRKTTGLNPTANKKAKDKLASNR